MATICNITAVLEKSKEYEYLAKSADPTFADQIRATAIVKQFITDRKCVIYGGMAIDYALRLKGDKIYPDETLTVPDLDFYSSNNVEDAYSLADILFRAGFTQTRVINATHTGTMRVDIGDNHFMADISYSPQIVLDAIPTLVFENMLFVHPLYQRIDMHSSLAYPYDDPPREVVFARWSKDIKRFNILDKYYPVPKPKPQWRQLDQPATRMTIPADYVLAGISAYELLYADTLARLGKLPDECIKPEIVLAHFSGRVEIVHFDPEAAIGTVLTNNNAILADVAVVEYEQYGGFMPHRFDVRGGRDPHDHLIVYSSSHELVGYNTIEVQKSSNSTGRQRVVNVQWNLRHFLGMSFIEHKHEQIYRALYCSLLAMISAHESAGLPAEGPLFPSITTYGHENVGIAMAVALNRIEHDLDGTELYKIPWHYLPEKMLSKGLPHPVFNPDDVVFFRQDGREIRRCRASDLGGVDRTTRTAHGMRH